MRRVIAPSQARASPLPSSARRRLGAPRWRAPPGCAAREERSLGEARVDRSTAVEARASARRAAQARRRAGRRPHLGAWVWWAGDASGQDVECVSVRCGRKAAGANAGKRRGAEWRRAGRRPHLGASVWWAGDASGQAVECVSVRCGRKAAGARAGRRGADAEWGAGRACWAPSAPGRLGLVGGRRVRTGRRVCERQVRLKGRRYFQDSLRFRVKQLHW